MYAKGQSPPLKNTKAKSNITSSKIDLSWRVTELDTPLLGFNIGRTRRDYFTLRDGVRGIQIMGGIGSGKSSGSGQTFALTYLKSGFGGVVLTGKINEVDQWKRYAKMTGREKDLIIIEEGSEYQFNPLQYEVQRPGKGAGDAMNLTKLVRDIYEMGHSFSSGSGGGGNNEKFWDDAVERFIKHAITLLILAKEEVSIFNLRKLLIDAFTKEEANEYNQLRSNAKITQKEAEAIALKQKSILRLNEWVNSNYGLKCLNIAFKRKDKSSREQERYQRVMEYFLKIFPRLPEKTRGIVEEFFYGMIEPFMDGILRDHFTSGLSKEVLPEETYLSGKIIVINFPVKEYMIGGVYAQAIYKKIWQEAIERRNPKKHPLPVFLWVDESQYFLNKNDAHFQTTARECLACVVYITQNISNYYAVIGGKSPKDEVNSLLGNIGTKIFHFNNDFVTNNWASDTIGKTFQRYRNTSSSFEQMSGSSTTGESLNYQVEPQLFTMLKAGGRLNNFLVEGIMTVAGKTWGNNKNYIKVVFDQNFRP